MLMIVGSFSNLRSACRSHLDPLLYKIALLVIVSQSDNHRLRFICQSDNLRVRFLCYDLFYVDSLWHFKLNLGFYMQRSRNLLSGLLQRYVLSVSVKKVELRAVLVLVRCILWHRNIQMN